MKTAVIYKTIHGSTKKYADWLAKDLKYKEIEMDKAEDLSKYDRLIVMSGTYGGRMPLTDFLRKNWEKIKNKELVIIAVGAAPENSLWSKLSYYMIPGKIRKKAKYFKIHGQYNETSEPPRKENLERIINYLTNS